MACFVAMQAPLAGLGHCGQPRPRRLQGRVMAAALPDWAAAAQARLSAQGWPAVPHADVPEWAAAAQAASRDAAEDALGGSVAEAQGVAQRVAQAGARLQELARGAAAQLESAAGQEPGAAASQVRELAGRAARQLDATVAAGTDAVRSSPLVEEAQRVVQHVGQAGSRLEELAREAAARLDAGGGGALPAAPPLPGADWAASLAEEAGLRHAAGEAAARLDAAVGAGLEAARGADVPRLLSQAGAAALHAADAAAAPFDVFGNWALNSLLFAVVIFLSAALLVVAPRQ